MARSRNVLRPLTLNAFIKIITEKSLFHMSPFSLLFAERQAGSAWYDSTWELNPGLLTEKRTLDPLHYRASYPVT